MKQLLVGDKAPTLWTRDVRGKVVDSNNFTSKYTLLVFLRYAGCPFCNLAIYRLSREYKLLKKNGCEVVAFIQSTAGNVEKNIFDRHDMTPPFSVVADHEQDFYRMFSVKASITKTAVHTIRNMPHWLDAARNKGFPQANVDGNGFIVPAFFLIDKDGIIRMADYSANFYEDDTFTSIYERLTFGDHLAGNI